jgi:hypothetical protein
MMPDLGYTYIRDIEDSRSKEISVEDGGKNLLRPLYYLCIVSSYESHACGICQFAAEIGQNEYVNCCPEMEYCLESGDPSIIHL